MRRAWQVRRVVAPTWEGSIGHRQVQHAAGPEITQQRIQQASAHRRRHGKLLLYGSGVLGVVAAALKQMEAYQKSSVDLSPSEPEDVSNWSATHSCTTQRLLQPETPEEAQRLLAEAHRQHKRVRVCGNMLSPNGCSLSTNTMLSMAHCDRIKHIDTESQQVTVEAGATCRDVLQALKKHGLTLQNFSSVYEQQLGGWIQTGAHGTGARLPPVEEQVVRMKLATPAKGTLELSRESNPRLFDFAKCGLGMLGIVTELTLQCMPIPTLLEQKFIASHSDIERNHNKWLRENKHLRYMWIPYEKEAVVVLSNPVDNQTPLPDMTPRWSEEERLHSTKQLLKRKGKYNDDDLKGMSFTQMRDKLVAMDPLNTSHIKQVNKAELEYWRRSSGYRMDTSDQILGFDCGGQQWVQEVAFPTGSLSTPDHSDLSFVKDVMHMVQKDRVPAPCPIEQRWSARSTACMSPCYSEDPEKLHSWVGVIMYLPTDDTKQRQEITNRFFEYSGKMLRDICPKYNATEHWAKIEAPQGERALRDTQERLRNRFPIDEFNQIRAELDPHNILPNANFAALFEQQM